MQLLHRLRRPWLAAFLGITLAFGGCGGGGGDGSGFFTGLPSPDNGEQQPPPGEGGAQHAARVEAMDRIAIQFEKITAGRQNGTSEEWVQLRDWALTQPEFDAAGVEQDALWARFKDGRYYLFTDNWRVPSGLPADPDPDADAEGTAGLKTALAAGGLGLAPTRAAVATATATAGGSGIDRAAVMTNSGPPPKDADGNPTDNEFASGYPVARRMEAALAARGYSVARKALTVENLKAMGKVSFFYFNSHSAMYGPNDLKDFAVMLDDEASLTNDDTYRDDLNTGRLIYHRVRTWKQAIHIGNLPRLAFTAGFVAKYLAFAPDALVITFSCNSGNAQSAGFRGALKGKGAGSIVGWNGSSNPNAHEAIELLVDRMAGVNKIQPQGVPNRAFVFKDVIQYLDKRKLMITKGVKDDDGHLHPDAPIVVDGDGFKRLAPVITHLQMKAGNQLVVHGDFGSEAGEVTVGGAKVGATWGEHEIRVVLDNAQHGEVVVGVQNLKSNPRQLGSWIGKVSYASKRVDDQCNGATFKADVDVDLHLRADMQAMRQEVDGPLKNNPAVIVPANDTAGRWVADGICRDSTGQLVLRHSGSGSLLLSPFVNIDEVLPFSDAVYARLDAVEKRFHVSSTVGKSEMTLQDRVGSRKTLLQLWWMLSDYFIDGQSGPTEARFPYASYVPLDARLNAGAGSPAARTDPRFPGMSLGFQWSAMQASPAFDDKVGN